MIRSRTTHIIRLIINGILLIPFLMVLSVVLVVSRELANGVVSAKYVWFYLAMGLAALSIAASWMINRRQLRWNMTDGLMILFCMVSWVVGYVRNLTCNHPMMLLILLMGLYLYFRIILVQIRWSRYLFVLFLLFTGLIESIWGIMQLYDFSVSQHSLFKTTGSFFNPGPYAGYLAVILPLALYFSLHDSTCFKTKFHRAYLLFYIRWVLSVTTLIAVLIVLPATWSRAAWIASLAGSLVVAVCFIFRKRTIRKQFSTCYSRYKKEIAVILLLVVLLSSAGLTGIYFLKKDSADGRLLVWKISLQMIQEQPWGVGLGNYAGSYGQQQAAYFASGNASGREVLVAGNPEYAFNEYLQIAAESGIAALALFLLIIGTALIRGIKHKHYAPSGSMIALSVFALMSYPFNLLPFAIVFVLLTAIMATTDHTTIRRSAAKPIRHIWILLALLTVINGWVLYKRYPQYHAYKTWSYERILYQAGMYEDVLTSYEAIYPYLTHEIQFLFEYAQALSKAGQYESSNQLLKTAQRISCDPMLYNIEGKNYQALKQYSQAEQAFYKAANTVPNRLYPYYLLGKLYDEMGLKDKVCEMAAYVHTKEAKVHSRAVEEIREEMQQLCNGD